MVRNPCGENGEMARISFVELPCDDVQAASDFYGAAFGWAMTSYGPSYACSGNADAVELGLQADPAERTRAPLARVTEAGGRVLMPIFAFPGGRRFHVADPAGNEIAVMQRD